MDEALRLATFEIGKLATYKSWTVEQADDYLNAYEIAGAIYHPKPYREEVMRLWRLSKQAQ